VFEVFEAGGFVGVCSLVDEGVVGSKRGPRASFGDLGEFDKAPVDFVA